MSGAQKRKQAWKHADFMQKYLNWLFSLENATSTPQQSGSEQTGGEEQKKCKGEDKTGRNGSDGEMMEEKEQSASDRGLTWLGVSGGARGHPDRGSSFPDRGAEVSACSTLPCKPPPTSSHYI